MFGLSETDIKFLKLLLAKYPSVSEAIIFGSRAKGNFKAGSDIDIALKGNIDSKTVLEIHGNLNEEGPLPYKIDIIDYNSIDNTNLKDHIDRVGIIFYTK